MKPFNSAMCDLDNWVAMFIDIDLLDSCAARTACAEFERFAYGLRLDAEGYPTAKNN